MYILQDPITHNYLSSLYANNKADLFNTNDYTKALVWHDKEAIKKVRQATPLLLNSHIIEVAQIGHNSVLLIAHDD